MIAARDNDFDVVLIDTAGRMQDNEVRSPRILSRCTLSDSHVCSLSCGLWQRYAAFRLRRSAMLAHAHRTQLVATNNPDKILFVGEALVGNEAVDQLTKFDRALRDFSSASGSGKERGIDGMIVTKWDTVDDKVCLGKGKAIFMISMSHYLTPPGRCCALDDIRHWPTHRFCRLRTGMYLPCTYFGGY